MTQFTPPGSVDTRESLLEWRERLERKGIRIMYQIEHEVIDRLIQRSERVLPEITRPLCSFVELDAKDAELTLQAAIEQEERGRMTGRKLDQVESVWRAKGELVSRVIVGGD